MWLCALKRIWAVYFLSLSLLGVSSAHQAIWVWEDDTRHWLNHPPASREAMAWLRMQGLRTLYVYAGAHVDADVLVQRPDLYKTMIREAHRMGFQVHALLGSGALMTEKYILPQNRGRAIHLVQRVLDYNQSVAEDERFDGINLDIEPHVLDDWSQRRSQYMVWWLQVSEVWMAMKRASDQSLKVGPAVPFWLDGIEVEYAGARKPASEHFQDIYDHVVLMDYRNRAVGPDGIIRHGEQEVAYGRKIGKPVWLGLEFSPNPMAKLTFDGMTPSQARHELARVQQRFSREPGYAGLVFHHYGTFRAWMQRHEAHPQPLVSAP